MLKYICTQFGCRFIMEKIDLVVVGAEGVVESGGIINKVGAKKFLQLSYIPNVRICHTSTSHVCASTSDLRVTSYIH